MSCSYSGRPQEQKEGQATIEFADLKSGSRRYLRHPGWFRMPFGKGKNDMVSLGICWYNIRERLDRELTDMMYPFMIEFA